MNIKKISAKLNGKWNHCFGLFVTGLIIISFFVKTFSVATFEETVLFLLFQVGIILLPGIALITLLKFSVKTQLELVSFGYAFGYVLNILSYYITVPFGLEAYLNYILIVEGILAFCYLFFINRKHQNRLEEDWKGNTICFCFLAVMLILRFFMYCSANGLPHVNGEAFYTADLLYYIGNAIELGKGYPPMDFRWYTQPYRYHFFGSMQLTVLQSFMNAAMATVEFCFAYIQSSILLVLGAYTLVSRLKIKYSLRIWSIFTMYFVMGFEQLTLIMYSHHIFVAPFGFELGLAFLLYTLCFVVMQLKEQEFKITIFIGTLLMFAACVGSKAPIAIVLLGALGILCAYYIFLKHQFKIGIIYAIGFLGIFLLIYFGVASQGLSTLNTTRGISLSWLTIIKESGFAVVYEQLLNLNIPIIMVEFVTVILYLIVCSPWVFIPFYIAFFIWATRIKESTILEFLCLGGVVVGVLLTFLTNQEGKSQMYFLMSAYPFAIGFTAMKLQRIHFDKFGNKLKKITISILVIFTIAGVGNMLIQSKGYLKLGLSNLLNHTYATYEINQPNLMQYEEYQAYEWIRKQTDKDDLLVSNVMLQDHQSRSFVTGVFTERHLWLEGWGYGYVSRTEEEVTKKTKLIEAVMEGDHNAIEQLIADGVDYIIQIERISPQFELDSTYGKCVYNNKQVAIYSLK